MTMASMRLDASIIIPVYNGLADTRRCFSALAANTDVASYQVIVVDNASSDGTPEFLWSLGGDVQIITNSSNLGFAKACNQGARVARGRYLVFLNNDTIPQAGWLSALVSLADAEPDAAIVGSKLLYPGTNRIQHAGIVFGPLREPYHIYQNIEADHPAVNQVEEFNAVTAACMLVRSKVFFDAGQFDEKYVNGYEDIDLCLKVRALGYRILYTPGSVLYHAEFSTPGRKDHQAQNLALFLSRWQDQVEPDESRYYKKYGHRIVYSADDPRKYSIMTEPSMSSGAQVVEAKSGDLSMRVRAEDGSTRSLHSMYEPRAEARSMADAFVFDGAGLLCILGAGMGYHIHELHARYKDAGIVVVEPVREIYDMAVERGLLPEGVRYIVGLSASEALREISRIQLKGGIRPISVFQLASEAAAFPSLYRPLSESLIRTVSVRLWERLRYPKFREDKIKVLLLDTSYFLVREVTEALHRLGHEVRPVPLGKGMRGETIVESIVASLVEFRPDFLLTINHLGFDEEGVLTDFLRSIELPAASWFVDSPSLIVGEYNRNVSDLVAMFIWDESYIARMLEMGFPRVSYMPLATDEFVFKPLKLSGKNRKRFGCESGFVGNSMAKPVADKLAGLSSSLHPLVEAVAQRVAAAPRGTGLDGVIRELAPDAVGLESKERIAFDSAVLWRATQIYRLQCVRGLSGFRPVIYGDKGWLELGLGRGFELRGPVNYYTELPLLYNACAVNFNATSLQMWSAVNQRVFDVPASGAFLLTDDQGAIDRLFEAGREIVTYKSAGEIPELVRYYLAHPDERAAVASRGRERVLSEHTYLHRLRAIIEQMRKAYS